MTTTLTVRLPAKLARELKAKARSAKTSPSAVLRQAAANYVRGKTDSKSPNAFQEHIDSRAGTWDGHCSALELLRKTRP
jgi:hypothetical protein